MAGGTAKLTGRDHEFREPTLRREVGSEDLCGELLQGEPKGPQPAESRGDDEAQKDFWSIQGDFTHRHQIELTVQFFVPGEESFPTSLKYIDVIKSPQTDLDVAQEKRIYDYWDVDKNRNLSDSWTGFTRFTLLNETLSRGFSWSGGRTDKNPNGITSGSHKAWRLDKNWKSRAKKRETRMGNRETKTRTSLCTERRNIPIPLKYVDVSRSTHTDLDVMQEKRIDDCWNVDVEQTFVRFMERIHEVHPFESKTSKRIYVVRLTKKANDYQT